MFYLYMMNNELYREWVEFQQSLNTSIIITSSGVWICKNLLSTTWERSLSDEEIARLLSNEKMARSLNILSKSAQWLPRSLNDLLLIIQWSPRSHGRLKFLIKSKTISQWSPREVISQRSFNECQFVSPAEERWQRDQPVHKDLTQRHLFHCFWEIEPIFDHPVRAPKQMSSKASVVSQCHLSINLDLSSIGISRYKLVMNVNRKTSSWLNTQFQQSVFSIVGIISTSLLCFNLFSGVKWTTLLWHLPLEWQHSY